MKRSIGLWAAIGLVVIANAVALSGVGRNRNGAPLYQVTLTENELVLPYSDADSSLLSLSLEWERETQWLDSKKLRAMGFLLDTHTYHKWTRSKDVFVVLRQDEKAWNRWLEEEKKVLKRDLANAESTRAKEGVLAIHEARVASQSRLFAVDAGLKFEEIRAAYANDKLAIVLPAKLEVSKAYGALAYSEDQIVKVLSYDLSAGTLRNVFVPKDQRAVIENLEARPGIWGVRNKADAKKFLPRYSVTLAFGSRLEPWVVSAKKLEHP